MNDSDDRAYRLIPRVKRGLLPPEEHCYTLYQIPARHSRPLSTF